MKVLSLFDGMGCGAAALKRAKINIESYDAFEVDRAAVKIAKKNHSEIVHHGDVVNFDFRKFKDIDLLIAGSPCQGFSMVGNLLGFDDPRSKLYFEYERARNEIQPKYFMLENVPMQDKNLSVISDRLDTIPHLFNSALVSAQRRYRHYWCNWDVPVPYDFKITMRDVLINDYDYIKKYKVNKTPSRDTMWLGGKCKNVTNAEKSNCLTTKQDRWSNAGLIEFEDYCRYLTPIECERLQTLPDNYTEGVSDTNRYKMIGNGWTINMIAWIFWHSPFGNAK